MSNASDFEIENGVLVQYNGPGGVVVVPDGVTEIASYAFLDCEDITQLLLPKSVAKISYEAFDGCTIPVDDNGMVILNGILVYYEGPGGNVVLPEGVTSIGEKAFYDCKSLTQITLPTSLTSIGEVAFHGCTGLTQITLPEGVTEIGTLAFGYCTNLAKIALPKGLVDIELGAFKGCSKALADENGMVILNGILFDYTGPGGEVSVPEGVTNISYMAFSACKDLTQVNLPESVTEIGPAFEFCEKLTQITLPKSVTKIVGQAFPDRPDFTIHGPAGSYAEQYAKKNNIPFIPE